MATRPLRVIAGGSPDAERPRWLPAGIGVLLLSLATLATLLDADDARRKIDVREMAQSAMDTALRQGVDDPEVRRTLIRMRDVIGWRPLDSKTRVVYSSLLLGLATNMEEMQLAAFHARRAAALSPVTVSVVRAASLVLANTGNVDEATGLVREMFLFDPTKAATTLAQIDSLVLGVVTRDGVPDDPDAWVAWASELRSSRRVDEATAWLSDGVRRWPKSLKLRTRLGHEHYWRRDWDALAGILPDDAGWPPGSESARLYALRALLRQHRGDQDGARRDAEIALSNGKSYGMHVLVGDLFLQMDQPQRARTEWTTALFMVEGWAPRRGLIHRLARLEDRWGSPAAALGYWREIVAHEPEHTEALRRIDDLTGFTQ